MVLTPPPEARVEAQLRTTDGLVGHYRPPAAINIRAGWLRDVILGGQDGLVNILRIVLGVMVGGGSRTVLIAAGFAAGMTESISM
jgi:hypothetical protein